MFDLASLLNLLHLVLDVHFEGWREVSAGAWTSFMEAGEKFIENFN
jgi:hypothetical protein